MNEIIKMCKVKVTSGEDIKSVINFLVDSGYNRNKVKTILTALDMQSDLDELLQFYDSLRKRVGVTRWCSWKKSIGTDIIDIIKYLYTMEYTENQVIGILHELKYSSIEITTALYLGFRKAQ